MNPSDVVISQGSLAVVRRLEGLLQKQGIDSQAVRPPGKDAG